MGRSPGSTNIGKERSDNIYDAWCMGVEVKDICTYFEMPQPTVSNVIRRAEERQLNDDALQELQYIVMNNRFVTLERITEMFRTKTGIHITRRRLRRYIHELDIYSYSAVRKPFIWEANKIKRSAWALRHQNWDMDAWSRVIFTDETSFEVRPLKRNMRVWRKRGERNSSACTVHTYKSGYELVSCWGGFSYYGKLPLRRIEGLFKQDQYKEICETTLLPWAETMYGSCANYVLQEDNCGPYRAITIRKFFEELGVQRMTWPPQSPDCNPIENAWGYMKNRFRSELRHPSSKNERWEEVQKLWSELPLSYFQTLIRSMATRVQRVLESRGGSTKY